MKTDRIRELTKKSDLPLAFLCRKIGVAKVYFNDIDKSNRNIPDDKLFIIADILNTTPEYLKGETDVKENFQIGKNKPDYLKLFDSLPEKDQNEVIALIEYKAAHLNDDI